MRLPTTNFQGQTASFRESTSCRIFSSISKAILSQSPWTRRAQAHVGDQCFLVWAPRGCEGKSSEKKNKKHHTGMSMVLSKWIISPLYI